MHKNIFAKKITPNQKRHIMIDGEQWICLFSYDWCPFIYLLLFINIEFNNILINTWAHFSNRTDMRAWCIKTGIVLTGFAAKMQKKIYCWNGLIIEQINICFCKKMINPPDRVFSHWIACVHTGLCLPSLSPSPIHFQARVNRNRPSSISLHL